MEMTLPRATVSLTLLFVLICTVDAMNYLAFPRMGRSNYLAFPRMGRSGYAGFPRMSRSQVRADTDSQNSDCCGQGLKSEFSVSEDGKEELHSICTATIPVCCDGLKELNDEKPNGVVHTMCVPYVSIFVNAEEKLKRLFSK